MIRLSEILFWLAFWFVFYTYFIYPLIIHALALRRPLVKPTPPEQWPSICIIIPVHNEAKNILRKLGNLREIDYPKDKLAIIFVSDGSSDGTNELLESQLDVQLLQYYPRQGKPTALNIAAKRTTADILIFNDARQIVQSDAIKKLVACLLQEGVGVVSGELVHYENDTATARDVGLYWRYEKWIRKNESQIYSVAGVTGALYAIRREDFQPIAEDTLLDDFEIPIRILRKNKRILLESGAKVYDALQESTEKERTRKIRTLTGNFQSFSRNPWLFSPSTNPIWLQFLSHKVFRLFVPYALIIMFLTSLAAPHGLMLPALIGQAIFYGLALLGHLSQRARKIRAVSFADVFVKLNIAAVEALIEYCKKRVNVKWEKTS